jgi:integrase/recombinase XerD
MLRLHRRHAKTCPHRSLTYRRCKCPVWGFGSQDEKRIRKSLDTQSWERAEEILRGIDNDAVSGKMTVGAATERFVEDCKSRHLAKETVGKCELLAKELKAAFPGMVTASEDGCRRLEES